MLLFKNTIKIMVDNAHKNEITRRCYRNCALPRDMFVGLGLKEIQYRIIN